MDLLPIDWKTKMFRSTNVRIQDRTGPVNHTSITQVVLLDLTSHRRTQIALFVLIFISYLITMLSNLLVVILVQLDSHLYTPMQKVRTGTANLTSITEFILVGLSSDREMQILLFVVILIIYLLTVMGNLMIIMLVWIDSSLHTPMYFFLTHLSCLEICYVTSTFPQMMIHLLSGNGAISFFRCAVQMYIALALGGTECILLAVMAYDRYLAICHPLHYAISMGRWRQLQLTSVSWAGGFLISGINVGSTLRLPFCGPNHINHFCCELPLVLKLSCADTRLMEAMIWGGSVLGLLLPVLVVLTSYVLILSSVLKMRSTARQHKAFSTCASHLVVVTMFYGTAISMYMKPRTGTAPDHDKQIAVFYIVVTPLLNPIIYTLRNKDVHGAVAKVLQRQGFKHKS
ncbi:olfactory receptor 2G3-like [Hemicordylus capensis]|uniref:olfactory receptor 2G3-like n=1 Tax=Hemicordylus capensis TaxID=884348 RepID=UPI0023037027|nr:olfactory receptor 2G3-like [Hemicordylus capensis]